jgi:EmrB/QacA subfamily drug resistance transporter
MTRQQILTFIAMGIGVGAIAVDIASINVALPAIEKDFTTTVDTIQWVVNGYALSFGVLMVTCGRLADTFGRRKAFFLGLTVFGLASLVGGLANDASVLIGARVVQGVGAALLWPSVIGIIYSSVSEEQKGFAVGLMLGSAGVGNAAGPLIGGVLTEFASWRWVLFVNAPLCVIAGLLTYLEVPKQKIEEGKKYVDYLGILTVSISLVSLMYALNMSTSWGWESYKTIILLVVFAVVMVLFVRLERRTEKALIPPDVISNLPFMLYATIMFAVIPALFGLLLYMPQYFEKFYGYSPLLSGASLVPMLLMFAVMAPVSGKIYTRIGPRYTIFTGMLLILLGTVIIIVLGFGGGFYGFLPGLVISGIGFGFAVPSITTAAVGSVRESRASLAGGIVYMFQLVGGALGLAVVTTIFTDIAESDAARRISSAGFALSEKHQADVLDFVLGSGSKATLLGDFGASRLSDLMPHIQHSYVTGLKYGLGFAVVIVALGAVIAIYPMGSRKKAGSA